MMGPEVQTFDEWLGWLFDHPVRDPRWYEDDFAPHWTHREDAEALGTAAEYLCTLFHSSARLLGRYTPAQIDQGMWFLISPGFSSQLFALTDHTVSFSLRRRGILAIECLFTDLYASACTAFFGHLDDGPEPPSPLNSSCYMWWDMAPLCRQGEDGGRTDALILRVQSKILRLQSVACVESALHGLGHMAQYYPQRVRAIVDAFLRARSDLPQCLVDYAGAARAGGVE